MMTFTKIWTLPTTVATTLLLLSTIATTGVVFARDECKDVLQARLDCYDTDGPCDPLPIPNGSFFPQPDPDKGYAIKQLREGMYAITEGTYNNLIVVAEKHENHRALKSGGSHDRPKYNVGLFDVPEGSYNIRDATGQVTGSLINVALEEIVFEMHQLTLTDIGSVQIVYSHNHMDHIGGATIVYEYIRDEWGIKDIEIIGNEAVKHEFETRIAADYFSFKAPVPTTVFTKKTHLSVGKGFDYTLTPAYGHSTDMKDTVVFFEKQGDDPAVMMFVDVIFPKWAPFFYFAIAKDMFEYLDIHKFLLEEFDLGDDGVLVAGHSQLGTRADIEMNYKFTEAVMDAALEAVLTVSPTPLFAELGIVDPTSNNLGNSWLFIGEWLKRMNNFCAKIVVEEYGCVLAGVDITVESACTIANSFWRVDY